MANILVVGGAGYIGAHMCKLLAQEGHRPVVFDDFSLGWREFVRWGPIVEGNIKDKNNLIEAITTHEIDAVMHFAARALVGESMTNPFIYYDNNVYGVLCLLDAMRETGVNSLVFSSTCATYGEPDIVPIHEKVPQDPINPYGASKLMAEWMIADFQMAHGLNAYCLRYFNACGADKDGEIGEMREDETHLIPLALMYLLGQVDRFKILGSDYPTPDGTAIRDYIHVTDLARAHLSALDNLLEGEEGEMLNLGTGQGYSIIDVIDVIERVTGQGFKRVFGPRRAGDPPELVAQVDKAKDALGFYPIHSDLENIIETAWRWHSNIYALR